MRWLGKLSYSLLLHSKRICKLEAMAKKADRSTSSDEQINALSAGMTFACFPVLYISSRMRQQAIFHSNL